MLGKAEANDLNVTNYLSALSGTHARLCLFSHDPRTVFQELGAASCRTLVGELYLDRKLSQPGHEPVADPGDRPIANRSLLRALLGSPLQVLSMSANGDLLIPDEEEVRQACPFEMNNEARQTLQKMRKQFPRPTTTTPGSTELAVPQPSPEPGPEVPAAAGSIAVQKRHSGS